MFKLAVEGNRRQALTIASVLLALTLVFPGCINKPETKECKLSLCDCKCYATGQTPEEKTGKLCGINCAGEKGVSGCEYTEGKCTETVVNNTPASCSNDGDCALGQNRCADGVDPYHVCQDGKCIQLTFVADPCMMEHTCPKGTWDSITYDITSDSCFKWANCAKTGCDDKSDTTVDECVAIGSKSEGCRYTVIKTVDRTCSTDADCVPEQCCHPTTCMNAQGKKPCNLLCTQVCQGPIDCGAGRCGCVGGVCGVVSTSYPTPNL